VKGYLVDAAAELGNVPLTDRDIELTAPGMTSVRDLATNWTVKMGIADPDDAGRVLARVKETMADQPYFASSSGVGGQVAGQTQVQALIALVASMIGIVAYLWVRFQSIAFGVAAVVALIHDVLVVVAAIALSYWLSGALGFLLVDDFRISLSVVAALLTIIGYSINDTIVIFDRIREVRGKRSDITIEMINQSISQTLSRTILTSATTLLVVILLYFLGGDSIHAFAFSMLIGVVAGTYSTVFIASPVLYWLMSRGISAGPPQPGESRS
jgi:SecD/SecF fusion protein